MYTMEVEVTISKLRQDLFKLVDRALAGEPVKFTHKGVVFELVPETKPSKLAKLTKQNVVAAKRDVEEAESDLFKEMEAEWEHDWSEL
jgi:antitoxin (DNA-binding transcriptional repressor) of toxin-antitoxin stability system